ncbi:hypothetical protein COBT_001846 [Conglomerata obtusa]
MLSIPVKKYIIKSYISSSTTPTPLFLSRIYASLDDIFLPNEIVKVRGVDGMIKQQIGKYCYIVYIRDENYEKNADVSNTCREFDKGGFNSFKQDGNKKATNNKGLSNRDVNEDACGRDAECFKKDINTIRSRIAMTGSKGSRNNIKFDKLKENKLACDDSVFDDKQSDFCSERKGSKGNVEIVEEGLTEIKVHKNELQRKDFIFKNEISQYFNSITHESPFGKIIQPKLVSEIKKQEEEIRYNILKELSRVDEKKTNKNNRNEKKSTTKQTYLYQGDIRPKKGNIKNYVVSEFSIPIKESESKFEPLEKVEIKSVDGNKIEFFGMTNRNILQLFDIFVFINTNNALLNHEKVDLIFLAEEFKNSGFFTDSFKILFVKFFELIISEKKRNNFEDFVEKIQDALYNFILNEFKFTLNDLNDSTVNQTNIDDSYDDNFEGDEYIEKKRYTRNLKSINKQTNNKNVIDLKLLNVNNKLINSNKKIEEQTKVLTTNNHIEEKKDVQPKNNLINTEINNDIIVKHENLQERKYFWFTTNISIDNVKALIIDFLDECINSFKLEKIICIKQIFEEKSVTIEKKLLFFQFIIDILVQTTSFREYIDKLIDNVRIMEKKKYDLNTKLKNIKTADEIAEKNKIAKTSNNVLANNIITNGEQTDEQKKEKVNLNDKKTAEANFDDNSKLNLEAKKDEDKTHKTNLDINKNKSKFNANQNITNINTNNNIDNSINMINNEIKSIDKYILSNRYRANFGSFNNATYYFVNDTVYFIFENNLFVLEPAMYDSIIKRGKLYNSRDSYFFVTTLKSISTTYK